jgi:adenosylcobinamide amidohydrolase
VSRPEPWRWTVRGRTLMVSFAAPCRVLSWAPLGGGLRRALLVGNHQVREDERAAAEAPAAYLARVVSTMGHDPAGAVMMMTGASVGHAGHACARHGRITVAAWCTAGCSNALRVGDAATVEHHGTGTVNLIVAVSEPLSVAAMAEAAQLAVEARVVAMHEGGVRSVVSGAVATGTGTDCVALACAMRRRGALRYCGKHTRLGELIGRSVLKSCALALKRHAKARK